MRCVFILLIIVGRPAYGIGEQCAKFIQDGLQVRPEELERIDSHMHQLKV